MSRAKQKKFEMVIEVDENDGDYLTEVTEITETQLGLIMPLIKALKGAPGICHQYEVGEQASIEPEDVYPQFNVDVHEEFQDHCPNPEYGFHTIVSITIIPLPSGKIKLL